ncbi:MAG TPA: IS5 family transposase [Methanoregulaceae archaeon]|nr:IS5 family transposase [Methanoregulaceae archaeon]
MGFKEYERNMSFLDMELSKTLGTSRTQRVLKEIHDHIRWEPLERILLAEYPVGKSLVGNAAYPPLMLLKAVLLQKWFGIRSDPELENQINDRVSFKVFVGLPLGDPSPDHSVISRFRDRVGSKVMERVHAEILGQLQKKGFSIDAGLAVDARLVKSASTPVSRDKIEEKKQEREQRKQDLTKKPMRFGRDLESDWTRRKDVPFYGMKEHASVDVISGLVMSTLLSPASEHDTNYLQYVVVNGIHTKKLPPKVYADKGYHGQANREFLYLNDIADGIMRKDERNATLTQLEIERNKMISKVRYKIEQYFGVTALHQGAGRARFTTLAKEGWDRLCHAIAFNIKRSYRAGFRDPVQVPTI